MPIGVQSIIAVGLGALIGSLAPSAGEQLKILGDIFLNLVQVVVLPLVFPLIVLGIARMESVKKVGRIAGKAILYFEIVTTVILLLAVGLAKFTGIGKGAPVQGASSEDLKSLDPGVDFHELVLHAAPKNIFAAFGEGNLLGAIVFALLVGVAMAAIGEKSEPFASVLESVAAVMFKVVGYVIRIAPLGVLGFISYDVAMRSVHCLEPHDPHHGEGPVIGICHPEATPDELGIPGRAADCDHIIVSCLRSLD
ncbi:cation:dicarboxylase symporter family transporter [Streptomyces sp. NPDC005970]|uniref:dicarboxylate/amino acid:cation symporter n=1 Tax=Streptomyces sp. NPDC005970 TaxID=3156723 RepID=UPI003411F001